MPKVKMRHCTNSSVAVLEIENCPQMYYCEDHIADVELFLDKRDYNYRRRPLLTSKTPQCYFEEVATELPS